MARGTLFALAAEAETPPDMTHWGRFAILVVATQARTIGMNGIKAEQFQEIFQTDDGKYTRIIFLQGGNPFYFEFSTEQLAAILPLINKAAASTQTGREVTTITVSQVEAWQDIRGELLLTLCNTAGARMTFGLSRELTQELSALVDEALQPPPSASSQN